MAEIHLKVAIIEDDGDFSEVLRQALEGMGCIVVAIAQDMFEATNEVIPKLEVLGVSLVFLDANLTLGRFDGKEGRALATQIENQAPSVKTVGFSSGSQAYVNIPFGKLGLSEKGELSRVISSVIN